jgi:4-hydroxybenzoyl-CoA thioesterase
VTQTHAAIFTVQRRVPFGDTDAAGSLFFSHAVRYCLEALEQWFIDRLGTDWFHLHADRQIGSPFVHAEFEFHSAATPRESLELAVAVTAVGRSSAAFTVTASSVPSSEVCWVGRFKCVFIATATRRSIPIPDEFRGQFERDAALAERRSKNQAD